MTKHVEETYAKIAQTYTTMFFNDISDLPLVDLLEGSLKSGSVVLDIGCGPGQFAAYLSQKGHEITGIDTSKEMLDIARQRVSNVTFQQMDMRKLAFADSTFDGILAAYSIIHIPTEELGQVLAEIKRVLKADGRVLFIAQDGEADQVLDEPLAVGEKIFMNFFSKERIAKVLHEAGFMVLTQQTITQSSPEVLSTVAIGTLAARAN